MESPRHCTEVTSDALMAYLYGEGDQRDRERVETHLATCPDCAADVAALEGVRSALQDWAVPDPAFGIRVVSDRYAARPWWRTVLEPSWGLAAAATLVLVVLVAVASIEVRYDTEGFMFRMGWTNGDSTRALNLDPFQQAETPATPSLGQPVPEDAPWLADLARLEEELRSELTVPVVDSDPRDDLGRLPDRVRAQSDPFGREQVEGLISESEQRHQQELALWFTQFAQEFDMQRRADQQRVEQELGALEGYTDYLVRVSQR